MAKKQYKIRWRDSDTAELQRVINNFNAKLYRLQKKNPEMADYLPNRVQKKDVINSIHTRADFNRTVASLKRFSARGAEEPVKSTRGAKATKWEVAEVTKKERRINREREKERNALLDKEVTTRGKGTGSKRSEMGSLKENALKPIKANFNIKSQKEWDLMKANIDAQLNEAHKAFRKSNMRLNYIKGLQDAGFSDDIVDLVRQMDIDKFIETIETDAEATFDFIYDPIDHELKSEALKETWSAALESQKQGA